MAMVMRVGYYCSAGFTETGGMQQFLEKLGADIKWERCFPAVRKPAPRLNMRLPEPTSEHSGVTGHALVDAMMSRLSDPGRRPEDIDVVLLIDDVDCRFQSPSEAVFWVDELQERVRQAMGQPDLPFVALLASPEIEAWLLVDWEQSFAIEYKAHAHALRRRLCDELLGDTPWSDIEDYGGPYEVTKGSCRNKLSEDLQTILEAMAEAEQERRDGQAGGDLDRRMYRYSKKQQGASMLRQIRPDKVAGVCVHYFRPGYLNLLGIVSRKAQ